MKQGRGKGLAFTSNTSTVSNGERRRSHRAGSVWWPEAGAGVQ